MRNYSAVSIKRTDSINILSESISKTRSVIYNLGIRSVSHQDSSRPPDEGAVGPLQTDSHKQYNVQSQKLSTII